MSFLPKNRQKRNQFFITLGVTVLLIAGIGFGLIRPQYVNLSSIRKQTTDTQTKLKGVQRIVSEADSDSTELDDLVAQLGTAEQDMATGDVYAWTIDTIRHFKANYKVEIPEIGQPSISQVDILPNFPYKQLKFSIRGTGYYHDIGKFIADFENKFPHMRVVNLDMDPAGGDTEKLSFRMDIIALVKSAS
jgi:hypothetical protein